MMNTDDLLAAAVAHQQAGKLDQAAALYDTILAEKPEQPDALHHSALIALSRGDAPIAVDRLRRVAQARPDRPVVHNDLGAALRIVGRLPEAEAALKRAVSLDPHYGDAWNNLGFVRRAIGDHAGAYEALQRAVTLKPGFAPTQNALGVVLTALGRRDEAVDAFRAAVATKPDYVEALSNLGLALHDNGDSRMALEPLGKAVQLAPKMAEAWLNLGLAQRAAADLQGAADSLRRAVALKPALMAAWTALGVVLAMSGDQQAASEAFRQSVELDARSAEALSNYGLSLHRLGRRDEARTMIDKALAVEPGHAGAIFNRAVMRQEDGDFTNALADWRAALAANPQESLARSNILFLMHYDPAVDGPTLCAAARDYDRVHGHPKGRYTSWPNAREPNRRLKIGYLSPDFREHSVAQYLEPLLAAHDLAAVDVFAYAEVPRPDATTERMRGLVPHWRKVAALADTEAARQIRADAIDILVDLAGHTSGSRLGIFALKPAPIQVTWLGYPGTTGLSAIDYRLTDIHADPLGTESHATETLFRLPRGFHCWQPPRNAPEIASRAEARTMTFGSFNNLMKISPATVAAWARILQAVPGSRLRLKSSWLSRAHAIETITRAFASQGISADRLDLVSWIAETTDHLSAYAEIDIALDPFPYNGTTTTLEALWMGVPVIALAGERHSARVGVSILSQIDALELIAGSVDDYVAKAVVLARDKARLVTYRHGLRPRLRTSPLLDCAGFARDIEDAYRTMWRRWCDLG